jgi:hypothetical protein
MKRKRIDPNEPMIKIGIHVDSGFVGGVCGGEDCEIGKEGGYKTVPFCIIPVHSVLFISAFSNTSSLTMYVLLFEVDITEFVNWPLTDT